MVFLTRLITLVVFLLSCFSLIRPRTGWGRLLLFIPKLYTGSFIFPIGMIGLAGAFVGWLISHDALSLVLGLGAALISSRHIYRIVKRSFEATHGLVENGPSGKRKLPKTMLRFPWIGYWKTPPEVSWQRDMPIGQQLESGQPLLIDLWQPDRAIPRSGL